MSDSLLPPAPPPAGSTIPPVQPGAPPPPPAGGSTPGFDFVRCFTFVFDDKEWLKKVLVGGLFYMAAFLIIGGFFLMGYAAQLIRNVINGAAKPLPEWDNLGDYFAEGFKLIVISLIYALPFVCVAIAVLVPAVIAGNLQHNGSDWAGGMVGCVWCLMAPLILVLSLWLPAALLRAIATGQFGAAFEFGKIWAFIRANLGNYLLAIVVHFVANFASQFGIFLLCIGIVFTAFLALCVTSHAFAQTYRLSTVR